MQMYKLFNKIVGLGLASTLASNCAHGTNIRNLRAGWYNGLDHGFSEDACGVIKSNPANTWIKCVYASGEFTVSLNDSGLVYFTRLSNNQNEGMENFSVIGKQLPPPSVLDDDRVNYNANDLPRPQFTPAYSEGFDVNFLPRNSKLVKATEKRHENAIKYIARERNRMEQGHNDK